MHVGELFFIAVGLSMDAFAVSVCKGLSVRKLRPRHLLLAGLYFGGFQALMPVIGWLLGSRFETLITEYEKEQTEVKVLAETEQVQLDAYEADTDKVAHFLALAKKYTDFTELTPQMIYEFVDKILVHAPEKIDGERTQEVEIYLKYIGKFDVPIQETMENPEAEKKRKQRKYDRDYKQRRKQEKLAAEAAGQQKSA